MVAPCASACRPTPRRIRGALCTHEAYQESTSLARIIVRPPPHGIFYHSHGRGSRRGPLSLDAGGHTIVNGINAQHEVGATTRDLSPTPCVLKHNKEGKQLTSETTTTTHRENRPKACTAPFCAKEEPTVTRRCLCSPLGGRGVPKESPTLTDVCPLLRTRHGMVAWGAWS